MYVDIWIIHTQMYNTHTHRLYCFNISQGSKPISSTDLILGIIFDAKKKGGSKGEVDLKTPK